MILRPYYDNGRDPQQPFWRGKDSYGWRSLPAGRGSIALRLRSILALQLGTQGQGKTGGMLV